MQPDDGAEQDRLPDEDQARAGRLARQAWLAQHAPAGAGALPPDSRVSPDLIGEVVACFVDGRFLAVILLGLQALEQRLAELFEAAGHHELARAGVALHIQEASSAGWITPEQQRQLERARRAQYVATHLRRPAPQQPARPSRVIPATIPAELLEEDASAVMRVILQLNSRAA